MCDHLLSPLHIQKLGHPIEEIRVRALSSVISKYNLNLVDEKNLENTKLLLEKLLDWFSFDIFSEEEKVLKLILKILKYKNFDLILKEINVQDITKKLSVIEKSLGRSYAKIIEDIRQCIKEAYRAPIEYPLPHAGLEKLVLNGNDKIVPNSEHIQKFPESKNFKNPTEPPVEKLIFKVEYFPWQHLISGDKHVLTSVYESLRYPDNITSVIQSCQFFTEVALRDFPTEVFIQRPLIIRTFLQLLKSSQKDIRIPILKCIIKIIQGLKESMMLALNASIFNTKSEFCSTTIFPNLSDDTSEQSGLPEQFHLNLNSFDEDIIFENADGADHNITKYQLSLPEFCFEILEQTLPHLETSCNEEYNYLILLTNEVLSCLTSNIASDAWAQKRDLKEKFYKTFGMLQNLLKFHKNKNFIVYIILLFVVVKLLKSLQPSEIHLSEILPTVLQTELASCISDSVVYLTFPNLHSSILKYIKKFQSQNTREIIQDYEDYLIVLESMKATVSILKRGAKFNSTIEKLELWKKALSSLDFHQNFDFIDCFIRSCLLKWRKFQLKNEELKIREKILIKLLAHCNPGVQLHTYRKIHEWVVRLLGSEEAANPKYDFPGDKVDFLFHVEVLTEIICHGLNSSVSEVRKFASDIISYLLKSKFIMSDTCWNDFLNSLIPCASLLQCFGDKSTTLGRCIIKIFDPDVAKSSGLPLLELLKGNIRFLFSKNNLTRDEAISRLFWLLSKDDPENKKLPRMSVLTGLNLSGICSCVKPQEFNDIRQSFYSSGRLCDVMEMLAGDNVEPNLRRSALSQISVMMDDVNLHATFLEQNGLKKMLEIFENCLLEKEYRNYPDSVIPIVNILKSLSLHNVCVRQELSSKIDVLFSILRGLFLFSSDDALRQNAVELLCLLLYSECILRVPVNVSFKCSLSFPEIVATKMCLPFVTHVHWKISKHLEPSTKKGLMGKNSWASLIRTSWAIEWMGSLSEFLALQDSEIKDKAYSPGIPDDMKICYKDIERLKSSAFGVSVKQTLYNIQNATTHDGVLSSLHKLHSYFLLYNIGKSFNREKNDISSDTLLSHMLWESTLERFMTSQPSCSQDEMLLLQIVRFVQLLLKSFKSDRLIDWVEKLLVDPHQPFPKMLKKIGSENFGLLGRELRFAVIELAQQVVTLKNRIDCKKWFLYLELTSEHLTLDKKGEFYNVAFVDWLLILLVDLTGKHAWNFNDKIEFYENLIVILMEIIIAFHCTKDSAVSFMGINIIKNSIFVLNHILAYGHGNIKDWEKIWFNALTKVIGHKGEANYCWLLSLWFMRDAITRAAAFQLFVGFSVTCKSCELLIDRLGIQFEHIWTHGFRVLFDENECCFVREKCALLLSSFAGQGTRVSCGNFLQHLEKSGFYEEIFKIILNFNSYPTLTEVRLASVSNTYEGQVLTTPSFVSSICRLLLNIISLEPTEVSDKLLECGIFDALTRTLEEIPDTANVCRKHQGSVDVLQMYTSVCKLITKCITSSWPVHSYMLQSQQTANNLFSMVNHNLFCVQSKIMSQLMYALWSEILDLFSALLMNSPESNKNNYKEHSGFELVNRSISSNGIDPFISSLYIALTSDSPDLRISVYNFLINLFRHEMSGSKNATISDIFERKISVQAVHSSISWCWKGLTISEDLTLNFGIRIADVLHQIFLLSASCVMQSWKTTIADCLGSLFAVCKPAQSFCIKRNLVDQIITVLKQICIKLNLECVENLKKPSTKKKVNPLLMDLDTYFRLLTNLMLRNEKSKTAIADCALSAVVHKLWPWCIAKQSLHIVTLKMLCSFTHSCVQACRTLVLSTSSSVLGLKKSPGSLTLMNSIMNQIPVEMDLILNAHDSRVLSLCLQLLSNCCRVTECRSVISKGSFLQSFTKIHLNKKRRPYAEGVVESWFKFFITLTSHQEGQLALAKTPEILDFLITKSSSSKTSLGISALTILRNICFHQLNRIRMLNCCSFLTMLGEVLESKRREEVQIVVVILWALSSNTQKAKVILRSSGFESKLMSAKRLFILNEDTETADLIEVVLGIFKNK